MKKIVISITLSNILAISLYSNTLQNQNDSLNHLFESKFPVDDYIYKGGFAKPKEEEQNLIELFEVDYDEAIKQETKTIDKNNTQIKNNNQIDYNATIDKIRQNQVKVNKEIALTQEQQRERYYKKLIKDSILAERNNEIREFNNNSKYGVDGFSNQKSIDISTNEHRLSRMIRAGRLIPAILMTAISSDLAGIVTAQIEQDIYAAHGRAVLIPRGSKAIGFYQNDNKTGQNRLAIQWREIITPQGINIMLTNSIVADAMGMSGAVGALNNKYWDRYALPYGLSTLSNALLLGIASKIDTGNNRTNSEYTSEIYSNFQGDINTIVSEIMQQQREIRPTIEIKSGSRIFIVPTQHMWFSKPKNGEVLMEYFIE